MRVHWTPEARAQLKAIHERIAQESPKVAQQVVARLVSRCGQLAELRTAAGRFPTTTVMTCVNFPRDPIV